MHTPRGQVMNLKHLSCIVDVEMCYDNIKYKLQAAQTSHNSYHLALNNSSIEVHLLSCYLSLNAFSNVQDLPESL